MTLPYSWLCHDASYTLLMALPIDANDTLFKSLPWCYLIHGSAMTLPCWWVCTICTFFMALPRVVSYSWLCDDAIDTVLMVLPWGDLIHDSPMRLPYSWLSHEAIYARPLFMALPRCYIIHGFAMMPRTWYAFFWLGTLAYHCVTLTTALPGCVYLCY